MLIAAPPVSKDFGAQPDPLQDQSLQSLAVPFIVGTLLQKCFPRLTKNFTSSKLFKYMF